MNGPPMRRRIGRMGDLFDNPFDQPINVLQQAAEDAAGFAHADQSQRTFTQTNPAPAHALDPSELTQIGLNPVDFNSANFNPDIPPIQVSFNWTKALAIGGGIALILYGLAHFTHRRR